MGKRVLYHGLVGGILRPALIGAAMAGCGVSAAWADTACQGSFPAPVGPMQLSREIHRSLADGRELVVTRHYRVTFRPNAQGFVIEGEWRGTDVQAPERLAALADMEKARADRTTFPMQLDRTGMIVSGEAAGHPALNEDETQEAKRLILGAKLHPAAQHQATRFVEHLTNRQGGMIAQWPATLFRPGAAALQTSQEMPLAPEENGQEENRQGEKGSAINTISAHSATTCGVMQDMERKVQTRIGGQMRETREIWTLSPAKDRE